MKKNDISPTMAAALAMASEHGGTLTRFAGGFWSYHGVPRQPHTGYPVEYFGVGTINGLVDRKRMKFTEWQEARSGRFPIAATIVNETPN